MKKLLLISMLAAPAFIEADPQLALLYSGLQNLALTAPAESPEAKEAREAKISRMQEGLEPAINIFRRNPDELNWKVVKSSIEALKEIDNTRNYNALLTELEALREPAEGSASSGEGAPDAPPFDAPPFEGDDTPQAPPMDDKPIVTPTPRASSQRTPAKTTTTSSSSTQPAATGGRADLLAAIRARGGKGLKPPKPSQTAATAGQVGTGTSATSGKAPGKKPTGSLSLTDIKTKAEARSGGSVTKVEEANERRALTQKLNPLAQRILGYTMKRQILNTEDEFKALQKDIEAFNQKWKVQMSSEWDQQLKAIQKKIDGAKK